MLLWAKRYEMSRLSGAFEAVSRDMSARGFSHPSKIVCSISVADSANELRLIHKRFDRPTVVHESFLRSLAENEAGEGEGVVVEKKILQVRLNGYVVSDPYGKTATDVEASLFVSRAPREKIELLCGIARRLFRKSRIEIHTAPFFVFAFLRDILEKETQFLALSIGEKRTEYVIGGGGAIERVGFFSFGSETLFLSLADTLRTVPREAESLLRLGMERKLRSDAASDLHKALGLAERKWSEALSRSLSGVFIPGTVYCVGGGAAGQAFEAFFKSPESKKILGWEEGPKVQPVTAAFISSFCDRSSEAFQEADPFLMIEALVASQNHA